MTATTIRRPCAVCGELCPSALGRKPRRYCSGPCEQRGYNDRRNERLRRTPQAFAEMLVGLARQAQVAERAA